MFLTKEKPEPAKEPDIIIVGGGKGGVGKSCLAVNMSVEIARRGWRAVIVDADLGCSNIETLLGMPPGAPLDDYFFDGDEGSLNSMITTSPYDNLSIVPGASGLLEATAPGDAHLKRFRSAIRTLDADVVVVDLDAGTRRDTLDLFLMASKSGIIVTTPEKTSMDNAFKFVRAVLFRKIGLFYKSPEVAQLLRHNETLPDFLASVEGCSAFERPVRDRIVNEVHALADSISPRIVVNRARNGYEAMVASNIVSKYIRNYLLIEPDLVGYVLFDKRIPEAVNSGKPFVVKLPKHKVTRNISTISNRLGYF
jgi:flagellar biosynthesis protein FlhG